MKKILIVEDESDLRTLLKRHLEKTGFECTDAEDGFKALERVKQQRPDLIILDLMLPNLSGEQVCKEIKSVKETKDIPIIMLTAKDSDIDRIIGRVVGADVYLTKPCDMLTLVENINKLLVKV
ncbi:MAG: response regulator [Candidatus Omnitrophota bacterium]